LLDVLTSIIAFASDTQLMRKLRATCCGDDPATQAAFKTKATVHIDWRWESMCRALDIVVPMYKPLLVSFNKDTLLKTESEKSILTSSKVKNCDEALRTPNVEIMAEGYRTIGKVIAKYAGELEICDCHRTLWNVGAGFKKRRRLMADAIGVRTCIWQGRRLAWFIFVGFSELK